MSGKVELLLSAATLPAIVLHGGAGTRPDADPAAVCAGMARACEVGFDVLGRGGSALDAAEAAVVAMEDDPLFNAGRGSCLTRDGTVEMDAAVMDGTSRLAGAVADVRTVRNPVRLARRVLEQSDHLLLVSEGAERFARDEGLAIEPPDYFVTPEQRARHLELREAALRDGTRRHRRGLGTVGAVAVDAHGRLAAATSTGGTPLKQPGRVGDTPIIGAGTYADDASAGVSCTGHGESVIRLVLGFRVADAVAHGASPLQAARAAAHLLREATAADGGLVVAAPDGRLGWAHNTVRMARALRRAGMDSSVAEV